MAMVNQFVYVAEKYFFETLVRIHRSSEGIEIFHLQIC